MLDILRLGESLPHFPPQLRKVWAGKYSLSDSRRAGVSCPLTPHSQRSGEGGRGSDSRGRAGLGKPFQPPPPPPTSGGPLPPLPRRSPHLFPRQLRAARAQGGVSRLHGVRAPQPALAGTKCAGLGPALPGAAPAGSLQTQSEPVSGRECASSGVGLLAGPAPTRVPGLCSPPTCPARPLRAGFGPSARAGHGARSGRSSGPPPPPAGAAPPRRPAPRSSGASSLRAAPAAACPSPAGASHFVGSSASSGCAPPSRSSGDAGSLAPAPGLRDPGVPAPGPALVPAGAPPRRAAAACAAPSSQAGGSVPAAGRTVGSARAAGSGLRGAATEPGLRVAASGRRAGGAGGGGEAGGRGRRERAESQGGGRERASGRRREGRPTSSATIIRLKQVQQLSPGESSGREQENTTWIKL